MAYYYRVNVLEKTVTIINVARGGLEWYSNATKHIVLRKSDKLLDDQGELDLLASCMRDILKQDGQDLPPKPDVGAYLTALRYIHHAWDSFIYSGNQGSRSFVSMLTKKMGISVDIEKFHSIHLKKSDRASADCYQKIADEFPQLFQFSVDLSKSIGQCAEFSEMISKLEESMTPQAIDAVYS